MRQRWVALLVALTLGPAACAGGDAEPGDSVPMVEVFGPFRGTEAELLAESLKPFEETEGINIRYTGTGAFVADLEAQIRAASPPDIALIPQPGLVRQLVDSGHVVPLGPEAHSAMEVNYSDQTRALGEVDGVAVGVPFQVSVKSLVWYRPEVFDRLDLVIPTTLDELERLAVQIEEAGLTPWCLGIESQAATGWVATDWTEEMVLRLAGPDVYDAWVGGDVGFSDPAIADAFAAVRTLALQPGRPAGGVAGVLRTSHLMSPLGLLGPSPDCVLHRQASFVISSMPPELKFGPDDDIHFFVFPGASDDAPAPLLVGSVLAVAFAERPEVAAVMNHLATPSSTGRWAEAGGHLRPHETVDIDRLPPVDRAATELLRNADIVRADASDAMAPDIGTGLLWRSITSWVAEEITYEELASTIDDARTGLG